MAHRPATAAPRSRRTALNLMNTRGHADGVDDDQERDRGRGPCSCSNSTVPMPSSSRPLLQGSSRDRQSRQDDYRLYRPSPTEALDRHT